MEEEHRSVISTPLLLSIQESSDSDDASSLHPPPAKRCRLEQQYSSFSSRFLKGIVLQHDGQWGARIHATHRRVWSGTFESDGTSAAIACGAAMKPPRPDTDLASPSLAAHEAKFRDMPTIDAALTMRRDGSCNESKLIEFLTSTRGEARVDEVPAGREGFVFQELFRKELTPSDVGKLNRLVIPKKQAERHFPRIVQQRPARWGVDGGDGSAEGMMLEFKDAAGRSWEFRYCYWRSSQSFVFTKGWNRFIRTKGLREGDVVAFYRCEDKYGRRKPFCMIDVGHTGCGGGSDDVGDELVCTLGVAGHGEEEGEVGLIGGLGGGDVAVFRETRSVVEQASTREYGKGEEGEFLSERGGSVCEGKKSFMLFGVHITSA